MILKQSLLSLLNKKNGHLTDVAVDALLVLAVFFSWLLFPVMLKFLAYVEFQTFFLIVSISVLLILVRYSELNKFQWLRWHKWFVLFWAVYLLFLLVASVQSGDLYSLKQYCIILYKVIFFYVLLFFMKKKFIVWSFRLYAKLTFLIVILSILVSIGVAFNVLEPLQYLTDIIVAQGYKFFVYLGAYYHGSQVNTGSFLLYRMQGFCEEPGTFAFAILPALFWFLIVEKSYFRGLVVALGLVGSFALGAIVIGVLFLPLFWKKELIKNTGIKFFLASIVIMVAVKYYYILVNLLVGRGMSIDAMLEHPSYADRIESISLVYEFLKTYPFGAGNALGMMTVNYPISVGYANAMLESGIIGGVAYLLMFGLLGWQALKLSLSVDIYQKEGRVYFVVAISVLVVLFMGLQRQQPDLSLWHMWIYASFFYLTMRKKEVNGERDISHRK